MRRLIFGLTLFTLAGNAVAQQHAACGNPQDYAAGFSSDLLRSIATTCENPQIGDLFYNRARLHELLAEYVAFEMSLSTDLSGRSYIESYRIFIGLAESFAAEALSRGDKAIVRRLNQTYDRYIEITELRMRGYDLQANHMERELQL